MENAPTVISTFAGCGGSSLGYKMAGYRELLAVEWEKNAADTFRLNFPEVPVWQKDVREVKAQDVLDFCKLTGGGLDVLDGSPPCQGFSTVGKRKIADTRNDLFRDYVRLIEGLQPRVFIMENVTGMVKGKMRGMFNEILEVLRATGYRVGCQQMNAKHYGVAQSRERIIFIGVRPDLNIEPSFPAPMPTVLTARGALIGLKDLGEIKTPKGLIAKMYHKIPAGQRLADVLIRTEGRNSYYGCRKLHPSKPSYTVTKTFAEGMAGLLHWEEERWMTIAELKRLSSFPDDFKFIGKFDEQWARIGNAVMPKFMAAIASHVKKEILKK